MKTILALDQGTTSSRAIVYDGSLSALSSSRQEFTQYFPRPGWVEHDAAQIWRSVKDTARAAIALSGAKKIAALGITNQRETIVVWDRKTGRSVAPAIVWQDRRASALMDKLRKAGREPFIRQKTGLLLDPYFSAGKLRWILDNIPDGRKRAQCGELAAGTIDSWLIFKLTAGRSHLTDVTNASRTMLMNIRSGDWDKELLSLFDIPRAILPAIAPSSGYFGQTDPALFGSAIPITGAAGDQQAALFGQLCTKPGLVKCTYGTGCFMLLFTGPEPVASKNRLLTTVAWKLGGEPLQYALEGSVFAGGAAIQWLRDGLKIIGSAPEVNELAAQVSDTAGVCVVPAFTGLGAPYWDPSARAAILGMTRGTTGAHIARATLEAIAFQVTDLLGAMRKDSGRRVAALRADGGACASDLLMRMQADFAGVEVERAKNLETTALGAAMLAGLGAGLWHSAGELSAMRRTDRVFRPCSRPKDRRDRLRRWHEAVKRSKSLEET